MIKLAPPAKYNLVYRVPNSGDSFVLYSYNMPIEWALRMLYQKAYAGKASQDYDSPRWVKEPIKK